MFVSLTMMFMFLIILMLMLIMNFLISKKNFKDREKSSPFECGFDMMSSGRKPFSLQFYLISIIFLIFDVEISLILPIIEIQTMMNYYIYLSFMYILLILLFGLYIEWMEGALNWFK